MQDQNIYLNDTIVSNFFFSDKGKIVPSRLRDSYLIKTSLDIFNYVKNRYKDSLSTLETIYRMIHRV